MRKVFIEERGWPGHFICASYCIFRRNTLLTCGKKRIVVSTVGNIQKPKSWPKNIPFTLTIGYERHYETMVFRAKKDGVYWDADVTKEIQFESEWRISLLNNKSDQLANDMHEKVVKEIKNKLITGKL